MSFLARLTLAALGDIARAPRDIARDLWWGRHETRCLCNACREAMA